ncbi:hypothetical protein HGRIS_013938 [Hohenbuehelia grisea]|uniref:Uncharacterized protein n=1 Tax=Hohenbuehelia grisea TaxID=104357 RepID=A0ABR3JSU4_9AGAR
MPLAEWRRFAVLSLRLRPGSESSEIQFVQHILNHWMKLKGHRNFISCDGATRPQLGRIIVLITHTRLRDAARSVCSSYYMTNSTQIAAGSASLLGSIRN